MAENTPDNTTDQRQVVVQRMFCRDASLEVPGGAAIFDREWQPKVDVQVQTNVNPLNDSRFQVTLSITLTTHVGDDVAYLVEAHQVGLFQVSGFTDQNELGLVLGAYCPSQVFPFARETLADLIQRGGFPPVLLQPINFDALYAQHLQNQQAEAANQSNGAARPNNGGAPSAA
jgi:protein-export chaperone SecB